MYILPPLNMHELILRIPKVKSCYSTRLTVQHSDLESGNLYVPDLPLTHTCIPTGRNKETTAIPEVVLATVVDPLSMEAGATPQQGIFLFFILSGISGVLLNGNSTFKDRLSLIRWKQLKFTAALFSRPNF